MNNKISLLRIYLWTYGIIFSSDCRRTTAYRKQPICDTYKGSCHLTKASYIPWSRRYFDGRFNPQRSNISGISTQYKTIKISRPFNRTRAFLEKIWEILWSWRVHRLDGAAYNQNFASYSEFANEGMAKMVVEEAMLAYNANVAEYLIHKVNMFV